VILLDVRMPGLSGFETAQAIRKQPRARHTPIIFFTANEIDAATLEEAYALGAVDFLLKPFLPVVLRAKVQGFSQVFQDKENARHEADQLRMLVHGTTDYAIFMLNPEGYVVTWNPGAQRLKGYCADEIIGQHFSRFYPQEAIDRGWPQYELKVASEVGRFEDEGWRIRKDGSPFWANVVITALRDEQGRLRGFSKVTRDLTERKRSEENARRLVEETTARRAAEENARYIQEQRERLRVTLASIGDAVVSTDEQGRITFLNAVAERLMGWNVEEAQQCLLDEVFRIVNEESREPVENPATRALQDGAVVDLANHTVLIARDGTERPIDDSAAPIRDSDNKVIGSVLVFRDVTERRRAEQHRNARLAITPLLNQANTIDEAATGLLRIMCEGLHWDTGFFWTVKRECQELECRRSWRSAPALEEFEQASCGRTFAMGLGLPGRVWASGKPAWIIDIAADANFPRLVAAANTGLRSAIACPITTGEQPLGVIEFFSRRRREIDPDLLDQMQSVATIFGQFMERKAAEEEVHQSEQRFHQLADVMPQIVWTARPDGNTDYMNKRWSEFTGLSDKVGNEGWRTVLHPDDGKRAAERWAVCLETGETFDMEVRLFDRHRHMYRWHLMRTVAARDEAGKVARWFGTATDIHEQKHAQESSHFLSEASAALASVVDYESTLQKVVNMAVPYFADWAAVDVADDGALRRLAVAHQDPKKMELAHELMRLYPIDLQAQGGIGAVFRTGKPEILSELTDDMLVRGAKDERNLALLRAIDLKSYICLPLIISGTSFGVLTFATAESGRRYTDSDLALAMDLAHRAAVAIQNTQLYQALRETDRRKDEFLATLAHELRNPLAPISNSLEILKMPRLDPETAEHCRGMMERQVHHLVRLVDDLLDVSRVMRGKIELRKERLELATVIGRAVETVQPFIDSQGHQLRLHLPAESLPIDADPLRLAQVVGNLLANAAKYTEANGRITVTAARDGSSAVLRVRDNGIGIAPQMLPRIFELFMQVEPKAMRSQGGLGIGLTLVKNLVEMHHGTVEAHSAGLGQGSEFVVRLPLSTTPVKAGGEDPDSLARPAPAPSSSRLLIVDDNRDAAISLAMLLQLMGHEVRVAHSGMAALEMTRSFLPDLIFLDIGMPDMDGYEVARRVRHDPALRATLLAALTGWGQQEDRRRSAEAGFDYHLVKPPEPKALENLLADLKARKAKH
ncbi:MAG TPA: PAS domain S-box protein, partial [Gemmataceae bacterium]|nr:PAS domain S-box protein [Gemmataceae bacterium]